jgi:ribonuclease P protein component
MIDGVKEDSGGPDQRFPRQCHIRLRDDFAQIYAVRRYAADKRLTVYVRENNLPFVRLGLSISKKAGGAVVRNQIKRRLREAFRRHKADLPVGFDLLCVVRAGPAAKLDDYVDSLCRLATKAVSFKPGQRRQD